jgi:hypothetical protein
MGGARMIHTGLSKATLLRRGITPMPAVPPGIPKETGLLIPRKIQQA